MNFDAFFHDMTLDYLRPAEPDVGRITDFRFRCAQGEASQVLLVWGNEHRKMKHSETPISETLRFMYSKVMLTIPNILGWNSRRSWR